MSVFMNSIVIVNLNKTNSEILEDDEIVWN